MSLNPFALHVNMLLSLLGWVLGVTSVVSAYVSSGLLLHQFQEPLPNTDILDHARLEAKASEWRAHSEVSIF